MVRKKLCCVPSVAAASSLWSAANVAANYKYYQDIQKLELRANDEAARAVGTDAAISFMKEERWKRDHGQNETVKHRLEVYQEWLGFCNHGSIELQLRRLEAIKDEENKD